MSFTLTRSIRFAALAAAAGVLAALAAFLGPDRAGAGAADSAAVRGYIVPTPNNPDVNPATTCAGAVAANDISDDQAQSPAGTGANAVTLAGCSYDATPYGGPSTEDRPVVFQVNSGPGGLLCGPGIQQSQVCALSGINFPSGGEYRVLANNEAGTNPTGSMSVEFCADDPPVDGLCTANDEASTLYTIDWKKAGGGGGAGGRCAGKPVTIQASGPKTKGTSGADVIAGRKGKDRISAKGGNDRICAKGGNDKVKGGGGKDKALGQGGKDKVAGGGGNDNLKGGGGDDKLNGGGGKDTCKGGGGKDKLTKCEKGSA